ncbi:MAG: HD domain-containing protein, partial [Kangiellaceae bacterium]|nr:HD domain-containing protein [Kangiellaceae bacterium]
LKDAENYTTEHQLRVSILCIGFGLFLGMSQEQIRTLGLAALLYDIGKARMPSIVLNKPTKINRQEALLLKNHPEESFRILSKVDNLSEVVKEVALSHHERVDGKGYPRHIHKDRVSRSAKIVSIIDAYDAITSDRSYSKARTTSHAVGVLIKNAGMKFDEFLVEQFVKWLTPTPIGSLVEMYSGEIAIVLGCDSGKPEQPKLLYVTDKLGNAGTQRIVDLAIEIDHQNADQYRIREVLVDGDRGIFVKKYLDKDAVGVSIWNKNAKSSPFQDFL